MREILFRAKALCDGDWVYGYYVGPVGMFCDNEIVNINDTMGGRVDVSPETVGQFTGLIDRHNQKIFENDIVEFVCGHTPRRYLVWWCREMSCVEAVPIDGITFNGTDYYNYDYPHFIYSDFCLMMYDPYGDFKDIKVIGNLHDNPELLGDVKCIG